MPILIVVAIAAAFLIFVPPASAEPAWQAPAPTPGHKPRHHKRK